MTNSQYSVYFFNNLRRGKISFHYVIRRSQTFSLYPGALFAPKLDNMIILLAGIKLSFLITPSNSKPSIPASPHQAKQLRGKLLL